MARSKRHPPRSLSDAPGVREAARALIEAVRAAAGERDLKPKGYERALRDVARLRGRPLAVPALVAPSGRGARVQLADGRTVLDFVCGIGTYLFGHSDPDLLETAAIAAVGDSVFQGHLAPAAEYPELLRALLRHAGPHIKHGWLSISGRSAGSRRTFTALAISFSSTRALEWTIRSSSGSYRSLPTTIGSTPVMRKKLSRLAPSVPMSASLRVRSANATSGSGPAGSAARARVNASPDTTTLSQIVRRADMTRQSPGRGCEAAAGVIGFCASARNWCVTGSNS